MHLNAYSHNLCLETPKIQKETLLDILHQVVKTRKKGRRDVVLLKTTSALPLTSGIKERSERGIMSVLLAER